MIRASSADSRSAALFCRVDARDVEAMLDAYDSGMCDTSTANCLSQVISRQIGGGRVHPLIRHDEFTAELDLGDHRVPVPADALAWLGSAETGAQAGPFEFILELPPSFAPALPPNRPAAIRRFREAPTPATSRSTVAVA